MVVFAKIMLVVVSVLLVITILLQSGRNAGLSGAITGGAEQMMGRKARGMDAVFAKITAGLATLFILLAVWVAWLVAHQ